jgi:hypothetical protein
MLQLQSPLHNPCQARGASVAALRLGSLDKLAATDAMIAVAQMGEPSQDGSEQSWQDWPVGLNAVSVSLRLRFSPVRAGLENPAALVFI